MKEEMGRIEDKVNEICSYLENLAEIKPSSLEEYKQDFKIKLMCERCAEVIVESLVDLAFLFIKKINLNIPQDDRKVFDVLKEANIISGELAERLKDAKGMRNILAHEYGKVNDEIVFEAVSFELEKDVKEFLSAIEVKLAEHKGE